jgi:hypothetical protein
MAWHGASISQVGVCRKVEGVSRRDAEGSRERRDFVVLAVRVVVDHDCCAPAQVGAVAVGR